ncbi:unnamed protein product [Ilex paraguariensis]|uniref:Uncharacterized protein n=1 Tax=Ilex paraguariensis TaxID=185542 RepID=A0ABC8QUP9_9AQUA
MIAPVSYTRFLSQNNGNWTIEHHGLYPEHRQHNFFFSFSSPILHFTEFCMLMQDGASLIRAMVSKEAIVFRQQLCRVITDVLYQWISETIGRGALITRYNIELGSSSTLSTPIYDYESILRDRRLKVIFFKVMDSARKHPVLMLRFCCSSFVMFFTASALACHRVLVSLSEAYLGPVSFAPKQVAFGA